jgi:Cu/Ag efflux pump CusA
VTPTLGPDATGVGWVYQYALLAKEQDLAELRSLQDWYLRYQHGQGAKVWRKWPASAASCSSIRSPSIP